MSDWPPGISDGLTLPCSVCGRFTNIDYLTTQASWNHITEFIGEKQGVICLDCFIEALNRNGLNPSNCIEQIQIIGRGSTLVFRNPELIMWPSEALQ